MIYFIPQLLNCNPFGPIDDESPNLGGKKVHVATKQKDYVHRQLVGLTFEPHTNNLIRFLNLK